MTCDLGDGKSIVFKGTKSATTFTEDDNTKLFVGTGNKLHYPLTGASINAQRAYFQLNGLTAGNASSGAPNLNIVLASKATRRLRSDATKGSNDAKP